MADIDASIDGRPSRGGTRESPMRLIVDGSVILIVFLAAVVGSRRGGLAVLGAAGGLLVGAAAATLIVRPIVSVRGRSRIAPLVICVAAIALSIALGRFGAHRHEQMSLRARRIDTLAGSVVAALVTVSIAWFLLPNLARGPSPSVRAILGGSTVVNALGAAPRPPDLLVSLDRAADLIGVPGAFAGVPPVPADPVRGEAPTDLSTAARQALASSIEVLGRGCTPGFLNEGSGAVVAPGYVVTSAHVLAGTHDQFLYDGQRYRAIVVGFDPRLDIAVVYAPSFHAPPLTLDADPPGRGTWGVTAGFPGGYHPTTTATVVRRSFTITGRDIYGREAVSRDLIELQSLVQPGDSGGPFVLGDGSLAGLVFAGSRLDQGVSYAVAGSSLVPIVDASVGSDVPVDVGSCVASP
jgi:S1-C subfamily serine protease